ncbi:HEAT repeat-containing protein 4 [Aplochiton taeniatus]
MPLPAYTEPGVLNQTVNTVKVKHIEPPLPPRLQDCLNPRAGSHVLQTENPFEQELFSGIAKQVHQLNPRMHDRIIMDNNSEYRKNLQEVFPCNHENWTNATAKETVPDTEGVHRVKRGFCRWVNLPTKADYATEVGLRPPDYSGHDTEVPKQQVNYIPMPELSSLRYAVEEWRRAWKIKTSWKSVTIEGLMKDLKDLHDHVRISAIATCASGAVNRPREEPIPIETGQYGRVWDIQAVPQELHPLLHKALDDPVKRVQMAAAVCQYAMGIPDHRAREILYSAIHQDSVSVGVDSWVAAQCLAMEGEHSRAVIERLLAQQSLSKAHSDKEQAASLLASISSKTTLVRSLLAEDLNCANWRARLLACNTLSQLKGPVNKDVGNKLIYLMWNDWNSAVRQTAAQALGKLGRGRDLHNELRVKLEGVIPTRRVEALVLLGQLQVMTGKLLPIFLSCLNDDFVSVRKQACLTAAALLIENDMILNQLIHLMQNDPAWEVKVCAINALGKIGCLTANLQELLLQAVHHEEQPSVRIAACEVLRVLKAQGPELQNVLQERFLVEPHPVVHRHIEGLLRSHGYSMEGDEGMVHKIKNQVTESVYSEVLITLSTVPLK